MHYRRKIKKLIYLIVTKPRISCIVRLLTQFIYKQINVHWRTATRVVAYIKSSLGKILFYKKYEYIHISAFQNARYGVDKGDRMFVLGFITFVGGSKVKWRSKKRDVISQFFVEAKYQVIAHITFKLPWL